MNTIDIINMQDIARQDLADNGLPPDTQPTMNILLAEQAGLLELSAKTMRRIVAESLKVEARNERAWNFMIGKMLEVTAGVPVGASEVPEGAVV